MSQITVRCDRCAALMVIRANKETKQEFLGCSNWPQCTETKPLPEHIKMERMGVKRLL